MKDILKELDKIDFHDIPVENVKIISDPGISVIISFFFHIEKLSMKLNSI